MIAVKCCLRVPNTLWVVRPNIHFKSSCSMCFQSKHHKHMCSNISSDFNGLYCSRDYEAMCRDYYTLQFMDPSVDTAPIAPALQAFFDNVLDLSVSELNFKAIVDGLGEVLFQYPFR